jgi:hypothetical protein
MRSVLMEYVHFDWVRNSDSNPQITTAFSQRMTQEEEIPVTVRIVRGIGSDQTSSSCLRSLDELIIGQVRR